MINMILVFDQISTPFSDPVLINGRLWLIYLLNNLGEISVEDDILEVLYSGLNIK